MSDAQGSGKISGAESGGGIDDSSDPGHLSFITPRPKGHTSSILPSAAFFSPRKPASQPRSPVSPNIPMASSSPILRNRVLHNAYSGDNLASSSRIGAGDPAPMDHNGNVLESTGSPTRPRSPWGVSSSPSRRASHDTFATEGLSSEGHTNPRNAAAIQSYLSHGTTGRSLTRTSRDPLLEELGKEKLSLPAQTLTPEPQAFASSSSQAAGLDAQRASLRPAAHRTGSHVSIPPRETRSRVTSVHSSGPSRSGMPLVRQGSKRNFKAHEGSNRFLLCGLIMTSADNPLPSLASLALDLVIGGLFLGFTAPFIWRNVSIAPVIIFAYIWPVSVVAMLVTSWRDPGVIPRNLDPDPPCSLADGNPSDPEDPLAVPLPRYVRVRGTDIKVKWCETCGTYRPPRTSHCRVCDNCVENIDHHCTFLNTCIGRRNYVSFFYFLITTFLAGLLIIGMCIAHLVLLTKSTSSTYPRGTPALGYTAQQAFAHAPLSAVVAILTIAGLIPLSVLFNYHIRLVCLNLTTVEQMRASTTRRYGESEENRYMEDDNRQSCIVRLLRGPTSATHPFGHPNVRQNLLAVFGRPTSASYIDRYGYQLLDERRDNPGYLSRRNSVLGQQEGTERGGKNPEKASKGNLEPLHHEEATMNGHSRHT